MYIAFLVLAIALASIVGYLLASSKKTNQKELEAIKELCNEQLKQQVELLREQFTTTSEREMKRRADDLALLNSKNITEILTPLNIRLAQMKEAVEKSEKTQTEATTRLESALKQTVQQAQELGKTTNNLVSALTRDNKYQGDFGEMQLRQLLESMGFTKGVQFEEQVITRNDNGESVLDEYSGQRKQPDVVLHFPDKRDIIIDAKTSTTAFLKYHDNTLSDLEKQQALREHIAAVRTQVKVLSKKNYWKDYNKGVQLDFVVMFIPIESAMQLALYEDPKLWEEAFQQGVFITGPQNLYALLRMIDIAWKQVAQVQNQQQIIDCADEIIRRVQVFNERFMRAKAALDKTRDIFEDVQKSLSPSGQSIITTANKLLKYGAKEDKSSGKKPLPKPDDTLPLGN